MKTMTNKLGLSTKLILLVTPLLFNQAYAKYSGHCGTLHLLVADNIYKNFTVTQGDIEATHGDFKGCNNVDTQTAECVDFVFEQSMFSGPDVTIQFRERNSDYAAKIRIQQNYCFFEAGDITVQPKKGNFTYSTRPGDYDRKLPGLVQIQAVGV